MVTATKPATSTVAADGLPEPTWEVAYLFPFQGEWDEYDYMELRPNRHVEFTNGFLEVLPMPKQSHQRIVRYLFRLLLAFVEPRQLGEALFAPLRVRLWPRVYREPDIVFMRVEHAGRRSEDYWDGADLVMEIVSADEKSRERDLEKKPQEYARAGIPEYWIVDPEEERITVLRLEGSQYQVHNEFGRGQQATSALLEGFAVDVAEVMDAGRE